MYRYIYWLIEFMKIYIDRLRYPNLRYTNCNLQYTISDVLYTRIQYWCIDGKYRIYVARLRNGGNTSFWESFHPFRAEPHKFYIYHQYTNIVFILQ